MLSKCTDNPRCQGRRQDQEHSARNIPTLLLGSQVSRKRLRASLHRKVLEYVLTGRKAGSHPLFIYQHPDLPVL